MKVFFIRHGESMTNANQLKSSRQDHLNKLTEEGIAQIKEASAKITEKIDCIYSSPYKRTIVSANIFIKNRSEKLQLLVDDRLQEINYGKYVDNLECQEMDKITRRQIAGDFEIRFGGGENRREIVTRFFSFVIDTFENDFDKNIVVFSHGRAISIIEQEFCQINKIEKEHVHTGNGTIKMLEVNHKYINNIKKYLKILNEKELK